MGGISIEIQSVFYLWKSFYLNVRIWWLKNVTSNQEYKDQGQMPLKLISFMTLLIFCSLCQAQLLNKKDRPPNFILIYTDDMGYADAGPFGNPLIATPAIDAMVEKGQTWTNFYSSAPVCTPSRGALLTGKLPVRTGLYGNQISVFFPGSKTGLPHSENTIAEVFQQENYATGMFGKWHLGDARTYYPTRHGFDEWLGIPYSNDMDWEVDGINIGNIFNPPQKIGEKWALVTPKIMEMVYQPNINDWQVPLVHSRRESHGVFKDRELERPAKQKVITQRYTNESINFIRRSVRENKPFFVYLAHSMPHVPLFRSTDFEGKSRAGIYGDVIEEIDWSVGSILKEIKDLEIDDNTYVVFTSDNGPWLLYREHAGSAKPLRNGKATTFEGGMRVMTVFTGPEIRPGITKELGMQTDLFVTFAKLAGFDTPKTATDSFDLSQTLRLNRSSPREFVPYYIGSELRAFRYKDHKIHFVTKGAFQEPPKRVVHDVPLLIDLTLDVGEKIDISESNPAILAEVILQAERFKDSITVQPSIVDMQFGE